MPLSRTLLLVPLIMSGCISKPANQHTSSATGASSDSPKILTEARGYGTQSNPVRVNSVYMGQLYLRRLRTLEGNRLHHKRLGSVGGSNDGHVSSWYKLTDPASGRVWDVYIDIHHPEAKFLPRVAPEGLLTFDQYIDSLENGGEFKRYINLSLPVGTRFCPKIVSATPDEVIVARVTHIDGIRDIQVLRGQDVDWTPLGSKGLALTGQHQSFLTDAVKGPDGRLWVLATYTLSDVTSRLFCFEHGGWGEKEDESSLHIQWFNWLGGLHFLNSDEPVRVFDATKKGIHLLQYSNGRWTPTGAQERLRETFQVDRSHPVVIKRHNILSFLWVDIVADKSSLMLMHVTGVNASDVGDPIKLDSWNGKGFATSASIAKDGTIAATLWSDKRVKIRRYGPGGKSKAIPAQDEKVGFPHLIKYSDQGDLYLVSAQGSEVTLSRLQGDAWVIVEEARQDHGIIFEPELSFGEQGEPILVWEDFFPM